MWPQYPTSKDWQDRFQQLCELARNLGWEGTDPQLQSHCVAFSGYKPTESSIIGAATLWCQVLLWNDVVPRLDTHEMEESHRISRIHGIEGAISFLLDRTPDELPQGPGPNSPDKFCWDGRTIAKIQEKPFLLLQYMWTHPKAQMPEVIAAVWGRRRRPTANAIKSVFRKANGVLARTTYPGQIRRSRGSDKYVTLE
jgi:hypothetical protein